ncbi:MAG: hypothetical protein ACRC8P_02980 [Spiroplasma sp.]
MNKTKDTNFWIIKLKLDAENIINDAKNDHSLTEAELIKFKNVIEKINQLQIQELKMRKKWSSEEVDKLIAEVNNKHKDLIDYIHYIIN